MRISQPSKAELDSEVDRLAGKGLLGLGYTEAELERLAPTTWRIARLKEATGSVVPAHVYQRAEVTAGAADLIGDSYALAKRCREAPQRRVVYCGVRFMAETAKILSPEKEVVLPALDAGCSLADSVTAPEVRALKAAHPGAAVVCYINTTAEVKAECDAVVTSANAETILRRLYERHRKVVFLPDEWMGRNLARALDKKLGTELVVWKGRCVVHQDFDASAVAYYRKMYPGVKILAHSECSPSLVEAVDFAGGTGGMMDFVRSTEAPCYMLVTECGLGEAARLEMPGKRFIPMCRLCRYMKSTDLAGVAAALEKPSKDQIIEVPEKVAERARRALERMFELAEG